jgi:hypothetical protein
MCDSSTCRETLWRINASKKIEGNRTDQCTHPVTLLVPRTVATGSIVTIMRIVPNINFAHSLMLLLPWGKRFAKITIAGVACNSI